MTISPYSVGTLQGKALFERHLVFLTPQKQIDTPGTEPPDNPTQPEEAASKLFVIAGVCVLLPLVYFLSLGPVIWAYSNGYLSDPMKEFVSKLYWPLESLAENWEPFEWLCNRYFGLWANLP